MQFFAPEIVLVLDGLVEKGMRIVACGLDQDFRGFPFGAMPELLCRAELVDKLQAVCHRCGGPATMTQRLVDGAPAPADGATIVVGALEQYEARCRSCHELAAPVRADGLRDARSPAARTTSLRADVSSLTLTYCSPPRLSVIASTLGMSALREAARSRSASQYLDRCQSQLRESRTAR